MSWPYGFSYVNQRYGHTERRTGVTEPVACWIRASGAVWFGLVWFGLVWFGLVEKLTICAKKGGVTRISPRSGCGPTITTARIWPWADSPQSSIWPWLHKLSTSAVSGNWGDYRVHEPPVPTTRLIAEALGVPLAYMYCEDDRVAALLLALHQLKPASRDKKVAEFLEVLHST